ncbi:MAG: hypothetical protein MJ143_04080 [Clostridia bacterium]|nr:hypothetical protein [Clostridia bacterium]
MFLSIILIFGGCNRKNDCEQEAEPLSHFKSFEVSVPSGWISSGNTTKFYYNDTYPATYLLIGEDVEPEEDIAKNLELFESTSFYQNKIKFVYEVYEGEKVSGVLVNERLEKNLCFTGYYLEVPKAYIFCVSESFENKDFIAELVDDVYSSLVS